MVARKQDAGRGVKAGARGRLSVIVEDEERRHLVEDCAFFRAARFRATEPGCYREQDLKVAEAEIDAVIKPRRKRAYKR